ncbi:MAG: hypothetical protein AB1461_20050, partial [Thermodesulfobacteriota bacterium]
GNPLKKTKTIGNYLIFFIKIKKSAKNIHIYFFKCNIQTNLLRQCCRKIVQHWLKIIQRQQLHGIHSSSNEGWCRSGSDTRSFSR